jgi:hypothetical protein
MQTGIAGRQFQISPCSASVLAHIVSSKKKVFSVLCGYSSTLTWANRLSYLRISQGVVCCVLCREGCCLCVTQAVVEGDSTHRGCMTVSYGKFAGCGVYL